MRLAASAQSSQFTSERLIQRLEEYQFFHQSSSLSLHLLELEKTAAVTHRKEMTSMLSHENTKSDETGDFDHTELDDLADELNAQLVQTVQLLYNAGLAKEELTRRLADATKTTVLKKLQGRVSQQDSAIAELSIRKDAIVQRLREIDT